MLPFDNSRRGRTTQIEVLNAIAERIREIPGMNDQNVVICDQPVPVAMPGGQMCISIAPKDGIFPNSSPSIMSEDSNLITSIYRISKKDRPGRAEAKLLDEQSILNIKRLILAKMCVEDPTLGDNSPSWEPTRTVSGYRIPLLREPPLPTHSIGPVDVAEHPGWVSLQLHWSVLFDWDLYS